MVPPMNQRVSSPVILKASMKLYLLGSKLLGECHGFVKCGRSADLLESSQPSSGLTKTKHASLRSGLKTIVHHGFLRQSCLGRAFSLGSIETDSTVGQRTALCGAGSRFCNGMLIRLLDAALSGTERNSPPPARSTRSTLQFIHFPTF